MPHDRKDSPDKPTISVDEAHQLLGGDDAISRGAFYQAVNRGEVPHLKLGKRLLIPRAAFLKWMEGNGYALEKTA
jgi:excisionase family DNA binding protein